MMYIRDHTIYKYTRDATLLTGITANFATMISSERRDLRRMSPT